MCKDMKNKEVTKARTTETAGPRKLIGLAALDHLDEKYRAVSQIRKDFEATRELHKLFGKELATTEELLEQMEDQIMDDAINIAAFQSGDEEGEDADLPEDSDDCGCGCNETAETAFAYDDEEGPAIPRAEAFSSPTTKPSARKRPGFAPVFFGALGVACAVASLVAQSLADEKKE
jgi:hypothetical protein